VEVVKSTSFQELRPALDRSIGLLGVPVSVTHDRGPPYNSAEWKKYAKEKGFETRACTPEHPEGNGLAERFMSVLVKTVHAAVALDKDPKVEVARRVMNYRNTPHPSTGKTPAELMMGRQLRTKVPSLVLPAMAVHPAIAV
jgi:transposase InsO family protein